MRTRQHELFSVVVLAVSLAGCPSSHDADDTGVSGMDAGAADGGRDASPVTPDTGLDVVDAFRTPDAGHDGAFPDTGVDASAPVGCVASSGVECDGDYTGMCTPACTASECCSPQRGTFTCVARHADGTCPLPDLFIDGSHIDGTRGYGYTVSYVRFDPGSCEIMEGCVDAPGLRRLLRWDTWTPNEGEADMYLGGTPPTGVSSGPYVWAACHMHHHFNTYANYELLGGDGALAATGHKQAFCLEDFYQYPCGGTGEPACRYPDPAHQYDCGNQGIEMGWQDVYAHNLPCQWIDVTDVTPGDYRLHISLNTEHYLPESNYDNNDLYVDVTVPPPPVVDITTPCRTATDGADRECGWTRGTASGLGTCTPGATVQVGCSAACSLGTCTGDTVLRVCDGAHDPTCNAPVALATNDDSGCGAGRCTSGDCCSEVSFICPASGTYATFWGPFNSGGMASCNLAAR